MSTTTTMTSDSIPVDRAARLQRLNVIATVLHAAQAVAVLVLANDFALPVASYFWNDAPNAGSQDAKRTYGKYEKVRTLGKGSFGTAVLLRHRRTGHLVVSKQVRVHEMPRAELSKVQRKTETTAP